MSFTRRGKGDEGEKGKGRRDDDRLPLKPRRQERKMGLGVRYGAGGGCQVEEEQGDGPAW
jgi:hypothetical protein